MGVKNIVGGLTINGNEVATKYDIANGNVMAAQANFAENAVCDQNGDVIDETYETKSDASAKLTEAKTYADNAATNHTHTVANISDLTATATELNYMDGVTSNVQTQLDAKASTIDLNKAGYRYPLFEYAFTKNDTLTTLSNTLIAHGIGETDRTIVRSSEGNGNLRFDDIVVMITAPFGGGLITVKEWYEPNNPISYSATVSATTTIGEIIDARNNLLETTNKTIVGAINEVRDSLQTLGTELMNGDFVVSTAEQANVAEKATKDGSGNVITSTYAPIGSGLPSYTTSNNGQFLRVVNGVATWATVSSAEEASF